jgi:thymidylate synthase (FAD)
MKVELKHITPDAEAYIGEAAAQCYDSSTEREACIRRAAHCMSVSHLATLRFAHADFEISGISRVASHQLVRVAHAGILQRSQRYVKETRVEYIDPPALADMPPYLQHFWKTTQHDAEAIYLRAIEHGMKKEDARYILPQGCTTSLRICGNFQMWHDILSNRTAKKAQWEVQEVALEILRQLNQHAPHVFLIDKQP